MKAFLSVGDAELSVVAVTGGIGEALIATACGLGIAILALVPFNYFTGKVARLQFELETAATNIEVMYIAAKQKGLRVDTPNGETVAKGGADQA
jgi:biopolymer transport protein ExbB